MKTPMLPYPSLSAKGACPPRCTRRSGGDSQNGDHSQKKFVGRFGRRLFLYPIESRLRRDPRFTTTLRDRSPKWGESGLRGQLCFLFLSRLCRDHQNGSPHTRKIVGQPLEKAPAPTPLFLRSENIPYFPVVCNGHLSAYDPSLHLFSLSCYPRELDSSFRLLYHHQSIITAKNRLPEEP